MAKNISEKIVENNPAGPLTQNGAKKIKAPEASEIVEKFLAEGLANFDYESLKPKIADSDINISANASLENIEKYVKEFLALTFKPLSGRAEQVADSSDPTNAVFSLILVYEERMNEFLALEVPKILAPLHKKHLALLGANKKIFELINEYDNDPLTSVLALNALNLIRAESVDIYRDIARVVIENKIKL